MLIQLTAEIGNGSRFARCRHCPTWFPVGDGSGTRRTRPFCSDRCRVASHRAGRGKVPRIVPE